MYLNLVLQLFSYNVISNYTAVIMNQFTYYFYISIFNIYISAKHYSIEFVTSLLHSRKVFPSFICLKGKKKLLEETNVARRMTCLTAIYSLVRMKTSCFFSLIDFFFSEYVGKEKDVN